MSQRDRLGRNYVKLFSSSTLTNLGDGVSTVVILWLASVLTRDPFILALLGFSSRLPWLLFALPAGVITDRVDRRDIVARMDLFRCAVTIPFALVVLLNEKGFPSPAGLAAGTQAPPVNAGLLLALLALFAFVIGCAEVLRDNAAQTLMSQIVQPGQLEKANSRLWGMEHAMGAFVGPPLGGLLIALAIALPLFLNGVLLALGAVLLFSISGTFRATANGQARRHWRQELAEGFRWTWQHRLLRSLMIILALSNLASAAAFVTIVLFAQEVLGLREGWQYGLVITGTAFGAVAASLLADRIAGALGPGRSLIVTVLGLVGAYLTIGLTSHPVVYWLAGAALGLVVVLWNTVTVSMRQRIIPGHLFGRVNSVFRFFGSGSMSIGTLAGGAIVAVAQPWVGREWALRAPLLCAALATLALLPAVLTRLSTTEIRTAESAAPEQ